MKLSKAIEQLEKAVKEIKANDMSVFLGDGTLFIYKGDFPVDFYGGFNQFSDQIIYRITTNWDAGAF